MSSPFKSSYLPPGCRESDPNAPWNYPDPDPDDCEVCGDNQGEFEHPELGWICWRCWPKCYICGKLAVWDSEGPLCEECEKKGAEEEAADV